jgi:hypothetical protein
MGRIKVYALMMQFEHIGQHLKYQLRCHHFNLCMVGKSYHILVELEHKAFWNVKQCNIDMNDVSEQRKL